MKLITTLVRPGMLHDVREALARIDTAGMTVSEVSGFGRRTGPVEFYRGVELATESVSWLQVDLLTDDHEADRVVDVLAEATRTDTSPSGRLWVTPVDTVVRIRTGEKGRDAI